MLRPFFTYYGGKWRSAPTYPAPRFPTIIEPFAGSAGYSLRYPQHTVILIEKDKEVAALWKYLIAASPEEIQRLPLWTSQTHVDDFDIPFEAKLLIGFWLNKGVAHACKSPSAWMRAKIRPASFWGEEIRARIAAQVSEIKHWTISEGGYETAPDLSATWFIDPPYINMGKHYSWAAKHLDYETLGLWCEDRLGQTIVCEGWGASWLPFRFHRVAKSTEGANGGTQAAEVIWTHNQASRPPPVDFTQITLDDI